MSNATDNVSDLSLFGKFISESFHIQRSTSEKRHNTLEYNSLSYENRILNDKFERNLYCDQNNPRKASKEMKDNFSIFYLFLSGHLLGELIVKYLEFSNDELSVGLFFFYSFTLLGFFVIAYGMLYIFNKYLHILYGALRLAYSIYFGFLVLFFSITDNRTWSLLVNVTIENTKMTNAIVLLCYVYLFRLILRDKFMSVMLVSLEISVIHFISLIFLSKSTGVEEIKEFFIFFCFLMIQCFVSYHEELNNRKEFWLRNREQEEFEVPEPIEETDEVIGTGLLGIFKRFNKILNSIKALSTVLFGKESKRQLKDMVKEIEKVKLLIVDNKDKISFKVRSLSEKDREFVLQSFANQYTQNEMIISVGMHELETCPIDSLNDSVDCAIQSTMISLGIKWDLDIEPLVRSTNQSFFVVSRYLLMKWPLMQVLQISQDELSNYCSELENHYMRGSFQSPAHAIDMLHNVLYFFCTSNLLEQFDLNDFLSIIVSCLGHAIGKTANSFLSPHSSELNIQYSESFLLQSMTCSLIFSSLLRPSNNFLSGLSELEWKKFKLTVTYMILHLDTAKHFKILSKFRVKGLELLQINTDSSKNKRLLLTMALKCGDYGFTAKPFNSYYSWNQLFIEEYYLIGDQQRNSNIQIGIYSDRYNDDKCSLSLIFLKHISLPLYEVWIAYMKCRGISDLIPAIRNNITYWEEQAIIRTSTKLIVR